MANRNSDFHDLQLSSAAMACISTARTVDLALAAHGSKRSPRILMLARAQLAFGRSLCDQVKQVRAGGVSSWRKAD